MSKLSVEEVEHIANLARLELTSEEKNMYAEQLSVVFEYVESLEEVNTESIEETCQVTGLLDVYREDIIAEVSNEARAEIIDCFPEKLGDYLKVKAVFKS